MEWRTVEVFARGMMRIRLFKGADRAGRADRAWRERDGRSGELGPLDGRE